MMLLYARLLLIKRIVAAIVHNGDYKLYLYFFVQSQIEIAITIYYSEVGLSSVWQPNIGYKYCRRTRL